MSLEFIIKLFVGFRKDQETGNYVGYCPNLGVYSQGTNQKEAEEALKSAITFFAKHGGIDKLLQEKGNKIEMIPVGSMSEPINIDNFNRINSIELSARIGRSETCQPCG